MVVRGLDSTTTPSLTGLNRSFSGRLLWFAFHAMSLSMAKNNYGINEAAGANLGSECCALFHVRNPGPTKIELVSQCYPSCSVSSGTPSSEVLLNLRPVWKPGESRSYDIRPGHTLVPGEEAIVLVDSRSPANQSHGGPSFVFRLPLQLAALPHDFGAQFKEPGLDRLCTLLDSWKASSG
jgi:hypothetical protein